MTDKVTQVYDFDSFGNWNHGRIITSYDNRYMVIQARNPYGTHNLVLCELDADGYASAIRHGNLSVFDWCNQWLPLKQVRKLYAYLSKKGVF